MELLSCVVGCHRTFTENKNLSRHKKTCIHVQRLRKTAKDAREASGHMLHLLNIVPKPLDRKLRLQAALSSAASNYVQDVIPSSEEPVTNDRAIDNPQNEADQLQIDDMQAMDVDTEALLPTPGLTRAGRPRRNYRLPRRFADFLPEVSLPAEIDLEEAPIRRVILIVRDRLITATNTFGIWRDYPRRPTRDPDEAIALNDLAVHPVDINSPSSALHNLTSDSTNEPYWPFVNATVHRVMKWLNNGNSFKSEGQVNEFVKKVILAPDFDKDHLVGFDAHRENSRLDSALHQSCFQAQFKESTVEILVPSGAPGIRPAMFTVPGLLHRKLTTVISDAFNGSLAHLFHFSPFKLYHTCPVTKKEERIFGEIYTSDVFLDEHEKVQRHSLLPPDDLGCKREKAIAALMFSSDATHLTNFGNAKAWPIYLMMGNLSKYIRAQPNSGAMYHLAYIPELPDSFQDFASNFHCKWRTQKQAIITHCRRELMQSVWKIILDDDFIHACTYGIVIHCIDGVERRIYPRIFTYSADYPEKVLLATIRDNGLFPCPRCLISKSVLHKLGCPDDLAIRVQATREFMASAVNKARKLIYKNGKAVNGSGVDGLLKQFSGVPTMNAFVERLGPHFNPSRMLVVDLLHEFELGVWKALFTHLIRLLHASGKESEKLVNTLDARYRQYSTFGCGTIRKFSQNSSEMKKLAARDFEDLLQCAIPAFEGLLVEPHNSRVMKPLYRTAEWHGLAKLRMHTDSTLALLESLTTEFGQLMHNFQELTCSQYVTTELPREEAARKRRELKGNLTRTTGQSAVDKISAFSQPVSESIADTTQQDTILPESTNSASLGETSAPKCTGRHYKTLNLSTVKYHFLGDYVQHIRLLGTTDSYSTQLGELAHRVVKRLYGLTNKQNATQQIGKKYSRLQAFLPAEQQEIDNANQCSLKNHHHISASRNKPINIFAFVLTNPNDPAKKNFINNLKDHLLGRLLVHDLNTSADKQYTSEDRLSVRLKNETIYQVHTVRFNYTTYDVRRAYNTVNPRTHPFVMVASSESTPDSHPYWYASVLGIFHADVQHVGKHSRDYSIQRMEFLWVRWMQIVPGHPFRRQQGHLPKVRFIPDSDESAFGFLDPSAVLRGCHLMPAFVDGCNSELHRNSSSSSIRPSNEEHHKDWKYYYVGIFVDRDMLMRFLGYGIGHKGQVGCMEYFHAASNQNDSETGADELPLGAQNKNSQQAPLNTTDEAYIDMQLGDSDISDTESENQYDLDDYLSS